MRERAESVGGELSIVSAAGQGATVTLVVPLGDNKLESIIAAPADKALAESNSEEDGGAH